MAFPLLPPHSLPFWLVTSFFKEPEFAGLGSQSPTGRQDQTWHRKETSVGKIAFKKCLCVVKCIANCNIDVIAPVGVSVNEPEAGSVW